MTETISTAIVRDDGGSDGSAGSLFEPTEQSQLREEWVRVQAAFVDDPHEAVDAADALVRRVLEGVEAALEADRLLVQKRQMEPDGASTEDLRTTMRSYRSFFERLLEV
jgi:hypothetical protein